MCELQFDMLLTWLPVPAFDAELLIGKLWIVDEGRIRIRPDESIQ